MKLKTVLLLTTSLALPAMLGAQPAVMRTDAAGYLERGKLMYESRNYVGAIDQLSHLSNQPARADMREEADYYIALSKMERDEADALEALTAFTRKYPASQYLQDVTMRIGNYHFYKGDYGEALMAYTQVRDRALDDDLNEDLLYRMAYSDLQLGNYSDAQALYRRLKGTSRYDAATYFYEAYIDYAGKRYDDAYDKFSRVERAGELGYQSQYYMCQIDYTRKQYDKVIALGQSLLGDEANDYFAPEINRLVGESYYHQGNDARARDYLNKYIATTQDPVLRSAAYALGVMDYRAGDYQSSIKNLGQVTSEDDEMAQSAYLYLGQDELKLNDVKMAAIAFEKAASRDFNKTVKETAFYNYAVTQAQGSATPFGSSITLFEKFLNDYPNSQYRSNVENYLVDAYMNSGDYDKALTSISHIKNPSSKVLKAKQNVLYNLGVQALQKDNRKQAADYMQRAIAVGNYDKKIQNESRLWLAQTQYDNARYSDAAKTLKTYLSNATRTDANYAKAYYDLGYAQYKLKNYTAARESFQKAVNSGNLDKALVGDSYDRIGDTYYYAADFANAEASYNRAIANNVGNADGSMFDRAMMAGYSKNYQGKIDQLNELLEKYPTSAKAPAALLEKGRALEALDRNKEAAQAYTQLANSYPKVAEARQGLLQLAVVEKGLGNQNQAIDAYKKVIKSAPTSDEAKVAAEDLKSIYADRDQLAEYAKFIKSVPNAPKFDVTEADRLTFAAAEKAVTASKPSIVKMQNYLRDYPNGAYAGNAKYYIGRYYYEKGDYANALSQLNDALDMGRDAGYAEDALAMKSDILTKQGKTAVAIATYRSIVEKSSSDDNRLSAQLGILRGSMQLKRWNDVTDMASKLLGNPNLTADETSEVQIDRAIANYHLGMTAEAEAELSLLSKDMTSESGSHAAYELGQLQYNTGNYKTAEKTTNALLNSGSPHAYWIARGYILLSDIYVKQGRTTEAREYLESLRTNYPGKEKDIYSDIDNRLAKLSGNQAKSSSKQSGSKSTTTKTQKRNNANSSADNKAAASSSSSRKRGGK